MEPTSKDGKIYDVLYLLSELTTEPGSVRVRLGSTLALIPSQVIAGTNPFPRCQTVIER